MNLSKKNQFTQKNCIIQSKSKFNKKMLRSLNDRSFFMTSSPKYSTNNQMNSPRSSKPIDEDDDQLIERILNGDDISDIDTETYTRLIEKIKLERDQLISANKVKESEEANTKYLRIQQIRLEQMKNNFRDHQIEKVTSRLEKANEDYSKLKKMIKVLDNEMIEDMNNQIQTLKNRQKEEVAKLQEEWKSESKIRQFNRTSGRLRNLRTQQQILLNTHKYEEMRLVKREADNLEKKETKDRQFGLLSGFKEALEKLQQKHNVELENLQIAQQTRWESYQDARKFDLNVMKRRISKLKSALKDAQNSEKVWNTLHSTSASLQPRSWKTSPTINVIRNKSMSQTDVICNFNTLKLIPVPPPKTIRRDVWRTKNDLHF